MFGCTVPDAFDHSWPSDQCAPRVSTPLVLVIEAALRIALLAVPHENDSEENEISFVSSVAEIGCIEWIPM